MRRTVLSLAIIVLCGGGGLVAWIASRSHAAPERPAEAPSRRVVPITQAVLFNTGVGYFVRTGTVEGDGRVELTFPVTDINDLLKSLTVDDGGRPGAVGYDGAEPAEYALRSFTLDLTGNPTLGQLLNQARGHKAEVSLDGAQQGLPAGPLTGTVVGMEASVGKEAEAHSLNLMCADGVRRLPLERVTRVRFLDPALEGEFKQALAILASGRANHRRRVWADLRGDGKRDVRIGYVVETPVWKATYRLALDGKAKLEARAVVENTGDEDWKDVRLTLVAGRPITFEMDLARPLFVPRPPVEPEFYASLQPPRAEAEEGGKPRPPVAGGVNLGGGGINLGVGGGGLQIGGGLQLGGPPGGSLIGVSPFGLHSAGAFGLGPPTNRYQPVVNPLDEPHTRRISYQDLLSRRQEMLARRAEEKAKAAQEGPALADGVESLAADASRIGEGFRRAIEQKVHVPRQTSALLPLHSGAIEATRFSLFNASTHPRFPMHAVRLRNTTGHPLMQGPVSVSDAGNYAGDCRLPDMAPGDERVLSFAMDLGVEVRTEVGELEEQKAEVIVTKGRVAMTPLTHRTTYYTLTNRSKADRAVVVEHPIKDGWAALPKSKPASETSTHRRHEYKVAAWATGREQVDEVLRGKVWASEVAKLTDNLVAQLVADPPTEGIKAFAERLTALRQAADDAKKHTARTRAQAEAARQEQERLRERIAKLPAASPALKRLQEELSGHEQAAEKLAKQILACVDAEAKAGRELDAYSSSASAR